jgi:hypothetical protein
MVKKNKNVFFLVLVLLFTQDLDACFGLREKRKKEAALLQQHRAEAHEQLETVLRNAHQHFEKLPDKNQLIFVDIDGTLVMPDGKPITHVITFCIAMKNLGFTLIALSSRHQEESFEQTAHEIEILGLDRVITELILVPEKEIPSARASVGQWKAKQREKIALRRDLPVAGVLDDKRENLEGDPTCLGYTVLIPELG